MAGEFVPAASGKDCDDKQATGKNSDIFSYIFKGNIPDPYPEEACPTYIHTTAQINSLQINVQATAPVFNGNLVGNVTGTASGNKLLASFDIPHATQKGKRIRHIIAEGPEAGIYVRGKIKDTNIIELPEYWDGLIDPETITVTLTQIGYSQDLIVERIEWGKNVIIRSGVGANIHCYYEVWAARWLNPMNHDEKLIVVYDGETPDDYPGDNRQFLIGGWDYDRRNPQWEPLDDQS